MRLLHVNPGNLFGGVESMILTMAAHSRAVSGLDSHFAYCFEGTFATQLKALGVTTHLLGEVRGRYPWTVLMARFRLARLLRSQRFDAIICHAAWSVAVFGRTLRAAHCPLVLWLHDPPQPTLHRLERWAQLVRPDFAFCNSRYTQSLLPRLYNSLPSKVIYCPVAAPPLPRESTCRLRVRRSFETADNAFVILQAGRWEPIKGHAVLVRALEKLKADPRWVCWSVGGTQRPHEIRYRESIVSLAHEMGVGSRIRFLGWQPSMTPLFQSADLFCQPNSGIEPFGITFIEALHAGLPVIGTNLGGPAEIVTPNCGDLLEPNHPGDLAECILNWMDSQKKRLLVRESGPQRAHQLCDPTARMQEMHTTLVGWLKAQD